MNVFEILENNSRLTQQVADITSQIQDLPQITLADSGNPSFPNPGARWETGVAPALNVHFLPDRLTVEQAEALAVWILVSTGGLDLNTVWGQQQPDLLPRARAAYSKFVLQPAHHPDTY